MPMREGCKFFESRTYPNGDAVRKCDLDLAPEAPWRCPEACAAYQPRLADVNWAHGSLVTPPPPPEPEGIGADPTIAALLDEAEDIINAVVDSTRAEVDAEAQSKSDGFGGIGKLKKFFNRGKG
jgi:hypothetical protein